MGDAGPNAVYRLVQREMGMAISGFKGKIKKLIFTFALAHKKRPCQAIGHKEKRL
ncbi:FIG00732470: hypothetical protein [Klebsiella pneumoniae ISC21]|nr:FIG00732470: hypothetical protein [Klebsiella pneumoniae ISC21]